jgi:asparagine synthase (glutamine-hydrolysing)
MLRLLQARACPNLALHAAATGMILTRPMIDKRLVEFALAIPEHLFARDGRQRDLARRALKDVLPVEFQNRRSSQEHFDEYMADAISRVAPEVHRQIADLGDEGSLVALFDFSTQPQSRAAQSRQERAHRLRALLAARYVAWLRGSNR